MTWIRRLFNQDRTSDSTTPTPPLASKNGSSLPDESGIRGSRRASFSQKALAKAQQGMILHLEQGENVEGFIYGMKWGAAKTALLGGAAGMLLQRQPLVILTNRTVYLVETRRAGSWQVDRVVARYPRGTVGAAMQGNSVTVGDYEVKLPFRQLDDGTSQSCGGCNCGRWRGKVTMPSQREAYTERGGAVTRRLRQLFSCGPRLSRRLLCEMSIIAVFALSVSCSRDDAERGSSEAVRPAKEQPTTSLRPITLAEPGAIFFARRSSTSPDGDIWRVNPDGSGLANVTNSPDSDDSMPSPSPDGRRIAFFGTRDTNSNSPHVYVANSDGSNQRLLLPTDTAYDYSGLVSSKRVRVIWSPDGNRMAITRGPAVVGGRRSGEAPPSFIYLVNGDGTGLRKLTSNDSLAEIPLAWSADGRRIVYVASQRCCPRDETYYSADVGGDANSSELVKSEYEREPQWWPEGRRRALERVRQGLVSPILNSEGVVKEEFTRGLDGLNPLLAWAPDGSAVAVEQRQGISVVAIDGSGRREVVSAGPASQSSMSADWAVRV
ncbi:MAG: TolB family protein [Gammaproteobacteria bacterium]